MEYALPRGLFARFKRTFIGDKAFYRTVLVLILPVVVQNLASNSVILLNNIMVGSIGTLNMSGVAIANQLIFVFNLTIFGAISGAGIYGAQFAGACDWEGFRKTFRFKLLVALAITAAGAAILYFFSDTLISLYLTGEGSAADAAAMLGYGKQYMHIMLWGLLPYALTQCYSGSLRETGDTLPPMVASVTAVFTDLTLNFLLIQGRFGLPALGVRGAAIATVTSRLIELSILLLWTHSNHKKFFFMEGLYKSLRIGKELALSIAGKSLPLLLNELLWAVGVTTLTQIFSTRGLIVVAGLNIASTISNLFNVFFLSMGSAVAVMIGQALGANDIPRARSYVWKLLFFSISICVFFGSALALSAHAIPNVYNTEPEVRRLATAFIRTSAMYMAFSATSHCCYFTIRSGGKTFLTMLFDSVFSWVVCVPYTYLMVHHTLLPIDLLYPLCNLTEAVKCAIGLIVVRTGYWARNMTGAPGGGEPAEQEAGGALPEAL
ncbi:MAG: MATE family efflux transporter [Clostridiaceae bacterium]|nr:MATE family efflux transporter [Eubacteriales bacterium]